MRKYFENFSSKYGQNISGLKNIWFIKNILQLSKLPIGHSTGTSRWKILLLGRNLPSKMQI